MDVIKLIVLLSFQKDLRLNDDYMKYEKLSLYLSQTTSQAAKKYLLKVPLFGRLSIIILE